MTPKEKALELKEKCDGYVCYAEVAIDEVLHYSKAHGFIALTEYYEQVKQELNKL